ncbi:WxcM-like domain-containing protein [Comamonas sp. MYb396]|uniref:WxcM-like domain-containing protein n=1 Tax=Comamonas sp. MYb396 TaxID=2745302 RepID=UPI0030B1CBD5
MDSYRLSCGATVFPTKIIPHAKGNIFHGLKKSSDGYVDFGEAYFSMVLHGEVKGWKKHLRMSMNLLVPVGEICFHLESEDGSQSERVVLGENNYQRLFVPPGIWMAFEGVGQSNNLLLNIASIEHDPTESMTREFVR